MDGLGLSDIEGLMLIEGLILIEGDSEGLGVGYS